jgi:hypothetical protein
MRGLCARRFEVLDSVVRPKTEGANPAHAAGLGKRWTKIERPPKRAKEGPTTTTPATGVRVAGSGS